MIKLAWGCAFGFIIENNDEDLLEAIRDKYWVLEIPIGLTPAGLAIDGYDIKKASEDGNLGGILLASLGYIPGVGDAAKGGVKKLARFFFIDGQVEKMLNLTGAARAAALKDLWPKGWYRGAVIEGLLAGTEYSTEKGYKWFGRDSGGFFPTFDFLKDGEVISLKTVNLGNLSPGYDWTLPLLKNIQALGANKWPVDKVGPVSKKVLDIRIPAGAVMSPNDFGVLQRAASAARVELKIGYM